MSTKKKAHIYQGEVGAPKGNANAAAFIDATGQPLPTVRLRLTIPEYSARKFAAFVAQFGGLISAGHFLAMAIDNWGDPSNAPAIIGGVGKLPKPRRPPSAPAHTDPPESPQ